VLKSLLLCAGETPQACGRCSGLAKQTLVRAQRRRKRAPRTAPAPSETSTAASG
jgi:hypothetical protein